MGGFPLLLLPFLHIWSCPLCTSTASCIKQPWGVRARSSPCTGFPHFIFFLGSTPPFASPRRRLFSYSNLSCGHKPPLDTGFVPGGAEITFHAFSAGMRPRSPALITLRQLRCSGNIDEWTQTTQSCC